MTVLSKQSALVAVGSAIVLSEIIAFFYNLYTRKTKPKRQPGRRSSEKPKKAKPVTNQIPLEECPIVAIKDNHYQTTDECVSETPKRLEVKNPILNAEGVPEQLVGMTEDDIWNTALFFPDIFPERPNSTTRQFIWYLQQAKKIMKVCLYTSSFRLLENAVFDLAKNKGVHVMAVTNVPRMVGVWRRNGVDIREKPKLINSAFSDDIFVDVMHHKFVIIDDQAVLGGSLNWTRSGVCENRENVVITNNPNIVTKFVDEFERIWDLSEPDYSEAKSPKKWSPKNPKNGTPDSESPCSESSRNGTPRRKYRFP